MRQPGANSSVRARSLLILIAGLAFCGCEAFKQSLSNHRPRTPGRKAGSNWLVPRRKRW
jgi:hypothetical protein